MSEIMGENDRIAELELQVERPEAEVDRLTDRRIAELETEYQSLDEANTELTEALRDRPAEVERLRGLVRELADDLEAEVMARYCEDGKLVHPAYERRLNRDMEPVIRARRALEGKGDE